MIAMELGLSQLSVGLMVMGLMLALMVIRIPIAATMLIPGFLGYILLSSPAGLMSYMKGVAYAKLAVYDLSVIPLFLLMGYFATQGGLSRDLFRAANALIGHVKGAWRWLRYWPALCLAPCAAHPLRRLPPLGKSPFQR